MPDRVPSILPSNATRLERAIEQATRLPDEAAAIEQLYRPRTVPAPLLPWLAWSRDVPLWPAGDVARRNLVADSLRLHRLQGTAAGLKELARLAGAEVLRLVTPPSKFHAGPSLTVAQRNAFLATLPELRIYRHRHLGQCHVLQTARYCAGATLASTAAARMAASAEVRRNGIASGVTMREAGDVAEIRIAATALPRALYCGRAVGHLAASTAADRLYRFRLAGFYDEAVGLRREAALPSIEAVDVRYDTIAETGQRHGVHPCSAYLSGGTLRRSTAADRLYQRFRLDDPTAGVQRRLVHAHLNAGRLGIAPHRAEAIVRIDGRASPLAAGRHVRGHLISTDKRALTGALDAMRWAQRASDRIAIDTAVVRPADAGMRYRAGDIVAGQWTTH